MGDRLGISWGPPWKTQWPDPCGNPDGIPWFWELKAWSCLVPHKHVRSLDGVLVNGGLVCCLGAVWGLSARLSGGLSAGLLWGPSGR